MGTTIKGISIEIGGNSYKLDKVLKGSTDASKSLGSELSQVNRQLKFNPDNTVLLTQKQEILSEEIKVTSERLKTLEDIREQIEKQAKNGDLGADQYRAYQREVETTRSKLKYFEAQLTDTKKAVDEFETGINKTDLSKFQAEVKEAQDKATKFKDKVKETAKDIGSDFGKLGAVVGAGTAVAVISFDNVQSALNHIQAQTGLDKSVINSYKEIIDVLYSDNYGEDKTDIATAMSAVIQTTKETDPQKLKEYTTNLITLRDTFDFEYTESLRSADMLTKQWGIDSQQAFNLIVQGAQNGLNKNGDLLDTINEYSVHYKQQGYSAEQFINSLINGTQAGTFSVDKLGDAMKEFGIRTKDTADSTTAAYNQLGFNADEMRKKFARGGESAQTATQETLTALFNLDDQIKQNLVGVSLFGTMWEDLGIDGVKALTNVQGSADSTADSMNKIKDVKYDDVQNELGTLARTAETKLLNPLVEKYYPQIKDFIEWTGDNLEDLEPIISFIAGTSASIFIGKKVSEYGKAIGDLVSVYRAYKTAADVATASQTALNVAQSANAVGVVVTAIGLLISGVMALSSALGENEKATYKVTSAQKDLYERIDETTESYERARKARRESVSEIESEYGYYRKLYKELKKITTQNGMVKKGYIERASFITSTLSNALGIEISMTGNQISNYQILKSELKEVIRLEEQRALLAAYESDYTAAKKKIGGSEGTTSEYAEATTNLNKAQKQYNAKEKALSDAKFALNQTSVAEPLKITEKYNAYLKAQEEFDKAEQNLKQAQQKFNKAEKALVSDKTLISNYETASEAIISGDSKKIKNALSNLTSEFINAENGTKKSLQRQFNTARTSFKNLNQAYKSGVEGIAKSEVEAAKKLKNKAKKELDKFNKANKNAGKKGGEELNSGYIYAIKTGTASVALNAGKIPESALKAIRKAQDSHSPSKKGYAEGVNLVDGYNNAVKDKSKQVSESGKKLIKDVIAQMNEQQKQLQAKYSGMNINFNGLTSGNLNINSTVSKSNSSAPPPITVQFNNVTVNSGDDINSLAQKISDQIAKEYIRKGL